MKSFSAIVVIALCLSDAVHSRGINTGELCSKEEFQCDETKCIKQIQICDKTADCKDGSDESGCECLLKGQLSCEVQGRCIEKEKLCNGDPCPNMKGNVTCPEVLQESASNISESTANNTVNITTMGTNNMTPSDTKANMTMEDKKANMTMEDKMANMTMEDKKANMTIEDKKTNMTMENKKTNMTMDDKKANMTMEDKMANMTMEDKKANMNIEDKKANMTMEDKKTNMTMEDKKTNMTMEDKMVNMTMEDKKANMTIEDKKANMTMEDKKANMTMEDKKTNMTMEDKMANMTIEDQMANMTMEDKKANMTVNDSGNFNATINEPVESKNNMTLNDTMMSNGNKSMDISNATAKSDANSAMKEIDANFTDYDTNDNETEGCSMSDSIACEEFDPPCISAIAYCNYSAQCPSQNRSKVCGEGNVPLPVRKAKLANLMDHHESEEKNYINSTRESSNEEHATKESLKVTESENEGDNHLRIIIPVAVIGGLCLVAIIIWFVTRRNKNVDSYALQ